MNYHPVVIEGMSGYDLRDPTQVSEQVTERLLHHWVSKPPIKPLLILTQGDPLEASGISAITPLVAQSLGVPRVLVYLDEYIHYCSYLARCPDRLVAAQWIHRFCTAKSADKRDLYL